GRGASGVARVPGLRPGLSCAALGARDHPASSRPGRAPRARAGDPSPGARDDQPLPRSAKPAAGEGPIPPGVLTLLRVVDYFYSSTSPDVVDANPWLAASCSHAPRL